VARHDNWLKRVSSRVANSVRASLLGDATPDTGCGLKLIRRSVYLELPAFDHMHRFLPALVQRHGGATRSVPVGHRGRTRGQSNYGLHDRLWTGVLDLLGVMWLKRRLKRPEVSEAGRP
jgi:dolichol-phosphate mannosyltransferase